MTDIHYHPDQLAALPDTEINAHLWARFINAGNGPDGYLMHIWQTLRDAATVASRLDADTRGAALFAAAEQVSMVSLVQAKWNYEMTVSDAATMIASASDAELDRHFFPALQVRLTDKTAVADYTRGDTASLPARRMAGALVALSRIDGLMDRTPVALLMVAAEVGEQMGALTPEARDALNTIKRRQGVISRQCE